MPVFPLSTAVLLFSRPACWTAAGKKLAGSRMARNQRLWERMTELTGAKIQAAGLVCVRSGTLLTAADYTRPFGEQLQLAMSRTLARGYNQLIIVGDDCPDLRVSDLLTAATRLQQGQLPIGYDRRGGIYLLGVDQRFLNPDSSEGFSALPWQNEGLASALTHFLTDRFGPVAELAAVWRDWNERTDVHVGQWLSGSFAYLAGPIWSLLISIRTHYFLPTRYVITGRLVQGALRAPPGFGR
ncbi:DUF2064 domain-containing protein [Spirosoma sp. 209]|uniref:DUF2064 domain-containing protein n=2 Tax=Spirosoma sordidisoli TaxID=2502893 RepID=A0A4Q2UP09_9BACT|nr:DUF2064 domain-containing protein [Spirosoma sp. 209]RYC71413.1 DUF2064 domain-containing protein [Spirosoma sordidisoli]